MISKTASDNRSAAGTFVLLAILPKEVILSSGQTQARDELLGRLNDYCFSLDAGDSFLGITEGILLAEEAHERGFETESWVLDAGMAPHERDWVAQQKAISIQVYFKFEKSAHAARSWLTRECKMAKTATVEFQADQDWNAQWKASFQGIEVDEGLRVLPPWHEDWLKVSKENPAGIIAINPGAGFGTGTHETTQLCLRALKQVALANGGNLNGKIVLDFGSGSGILGITAAKMGATVYCAEVDPMANDNALENSQLNQVQDRVEISEVIPEKLMGSESGKGKADIVLANILRPILVQFAPQIMACLKPESDLILSGLIESDVAQVTSIYKPFKKIQNFEKGEWRAIHFTR